MLSNSSVVIGANLAEICVDRNIRLVPKQLTLVAELTNAINNNLFSEINQRDFVEHSIVLASSGVESEARGIKTYAQSTHDSFMDTSVDDLSRLVSNYISFARNVVNKEVNYLKETLASGLANYKYREPEEFFNVNYFKLHEVYNTHIVEAEINPYRDSSRKYFFESLNLTPVFTEDFDLNKYLLTGDEGEDAIIQTWLSGVGKAKAIHFLTENIPEYNLSVDALLDYALVNYIFYRNVVERSDLNLGLSTVQLRTKATANRDYYGNKLSVALDLFQKELRIGKLLSSSSETQFSYFNSNSLNITIYEENFTKLAEGGGTIEVLFGYIATKGDVNVTVEGLLAEKENYLQKWMNTRSLYLVSLNNNRLSIFKQILSEVFENSLKKDDINEDEQSYLNENPKFSGETIAEARCYIDDLHVSDIDDIDTIALDLVARIRYRFTNAYFILKEMAEIMAMSDKVEPMEAALYATVRYLTDHFMEQIDIVKF